MKRTTVYLEEDVDLELAELARQQDSSKAELIRKALNGFVKAERQENPPVPSWVGAGRSGQPDLAERDEEILAEILDEKHERIIKEWQEQE